LILALSKKNTGYMSSVKNAPIKPVIITKSHVVVEGSLYTKKIKQIKKLLGKSTFLSS
jgi:hypothetical protein